jgi:hypothetical protein
MIEDGGVGKYMQSLHSRYQSGWVVASVDGVLVGR